MGGDVSDAAGWRGTLVERDDALARLQDAAARARAGQGAIAIVTGEAGAGKTSVINEFVRRTEDRGLIARGACDPLAVPRPLGPLIDAAGDVDAVLAQRLTAGTSRAEAFGIALGILDGTRSGGRLTVFVLEDAHWADEATLDLLVFLGRRVSAYPTLLDVARTKGTLKPGF